MSTAKPLSALTLSSLVLLASSPSLGATFTRNAQPVVTSSQTSIPSIRRNCTTARVWFDGRCRTEAWFDNHLSRADRELLFILGATDHALFGGEDDGVILVERVDDGTVEYTFVEGDAPASRGTYTLASMGPKRGGYPVEAVHTVNYSYNADEQLVVYTETKTPVSAFSGPLGGGYGWSWDVIDWEQKTWLSGSAIEICDETGCGMAYAYSGEWTCEHLYDAAYSQAANRCAIGLGTAAAVIGGVGALIAVGASGGLAVLATPVAMAAAGTYAGSAAGVVHYLCANSATQAAVSELLENGCIEDDPDPGDFEPGGDIPGDDETDTSVGCMACTSWEYQSFDTSYWDEDSGELTVESHSELVCSEWSLDPSGTDANGDGWCD
jgi:hypothetical protein